jgi:hypothetical protein
MSRGLTDPIEEPQEPNDEIDQVIRDLIIGQNKLHDRLVDLERKLDHLTMPVETSQTKVKPWKRGL